MCIPSGQRPARYSIAAKYEVAKRIAEIEAALPFAILGFDTDNAGEFLNWHLVNYFARRRSPVGFTRSRAYRKNDNARVEQKNWTHVRQLVGYARLEDPRAAELLNELYAKEWGGFATSGVGHHVALSIVGCDRIPGSGYLRASCSGEVERWCSRQ